MAPVLTRGLVNTRSQFDARFPGRDTRSDGWIGNLPHQASVSGHNPDRTGRAEFKDGDGKDEVRAIDVDSDLVPGSPIDWMELVVQYLIQRARAGHYIPFRYIIYKGRIWARSDRWQTRQYTGENKHDQHAHFSGDYTQFADEWTGSLGLENVTGGDMEVKDLNAALRDADSPLTEISRAIPWQYDGRGIPAGMTTLSVLSAIHGYAKTTNQLVQMLVNDDDVDEEKLAQALAPAVAGLVTPAIVAAIEANGGQPLTTGQVTEAVKTALREGTV